MKQNTVLGMLTGAVVLLVVMLLIGGSSYERALQRERSALLSVELEKQSKTELIQKYATDQAGALENSTKAWDRFLEMERAKLDCEDRVTAMSYTCDKAPPPPAFGKAKTPAPLAGSGATAWAE